MARGTTVEDYAPEVNNGEEGEISIIEQSKEEVDVEYDVDKLVGWPGFNVEPDKDYKEECRRYRVPPLQLDRTSPNFQSLVAMKQRLAAHEQKGYVRGEMQNTNVSTILPDTQAKAKEGIEPEPPGMCNSNIDMEAVSYTHLTLPTKA